MTGQHLEGTPRTVVLPPRRHPGDPPRGVRRRARPDRRVATTPDRPVPALELGDEDVIRLASESPHNGEKFRRLWSGDTSDYAVDGNDGASEADAAICELLAYYGGPDRERIERLWLRSGLGAREKVQRADYRQRTIDLALRGKTRFYGDSVQARQRRRLDRTARTAAPATPARPARGWLPGAGAAGPRRPDRRVSRRSPRTAPGAPG